MNKSLIKIFVADSSFRQAAPLEDYVASLETRSIQSFLLTVANGHQSFSSLVKL